MRLFPGPGIFTYRSRGNDRMAERFVTGSRRITMIVSLRSPVRAPLSSSWTQPLSVELSAPVTRKLIACVFSGGNYSGVAVFSGNVWPGAAVTAVLGVDGMGPLAPALISTLRP